MRLCIYVKFTRKNLLPVLKNLDLSIFTIFVVTDETEFYIPVMVSVVTRILQSSWKSFRLPWLQEYTYVPQVVVHLYV